MEERQRVMESETNPLLCTWEALLNKLPFRVTGKVLGPRDANPIGEHLSPLKEIFIIPLLQVFQAKICPVFASRQ